MSKTRYRHPGIGGIGEATSECVVVVPRFYDKGDKALIRVRDPRCPAGTLTSYRIIDEFSIMHDGSRDEECRVERGAE